MLELQWLLELGLALALALALAGEPPFPLELELELVCNGCTPCGCQTQTACDTHQRCFWLVLLLPKPSKLQSGPNDLRSSGARANRATDHDHTNSMWTWDRWDPLRRCDLVLVCALRQDQHPDWMREGWHRCRSSNLVHR